MTMMKKAFIVYVDVMQFYLTPYTFILLNEQYKQ